MFKKKICKKCKTKISPTYEFCPYCGLSQTNSQENNWGFLGRSDENFNKENSLENPFGGIGGNFLGKMINNAMKMMENEMQKEMKNQENIPQKTNIRLMINGKEVKLNQTPKTQKKETIIKGISQKQLPQNNLKDFSKLPKEVPITNIKRLSDKVIYEIQIPGVNSLENISIIKLENSIEIKAISKDKAYSKVIPLTLPIVAYDLSKGTLILELGEK